MFEERELGAHFKKRANSAAFGDGPRQVSHTAEKLYLNIQFARSGFWFITMWLPWTAKMSQYPLRDSCSSNNVPCPGKAWIYIYFEMKTLYSMLVNPILPLPASGNICSVASRGTPLLGVSSGVIGQNQWVSPLNCWAHNPSNSMLSGMNWVLLKGYLSSVGHPASIYHRTTSQHLCQIPIYHPMPIQTQAKLKYANPRGRTSSESRRYETLVGKYGVVITLYAPTAARC